MPAKSRETTKNTTVTESCNSSNSLRGSPGFDSSKPLSHHIRIAIADHDIQAMYDLKAICDKLHSGIPEYKGFTQLPKDQLYDEMDNKIKSFHDLSLKLDMAINSDSSNCKLITAKGMRNDDASISKHETRLPELWMGSIPKYQYIKPIHDAIITPKFDGVSCGVKYTRSVDGVFEPVKATTRGVSTSHKQESTDITEKYKSITSSFTEALNKELNNPEPFAFSNGLLLANISSILFRGEIVAKCAAELTTAAASFVAGKVNGGMDVWNKAKNSICFIPYEIMYVVLTDNTLKRIRTKNDIPSETLTVTTQSLSSDVPIYEALASSNQLDTKLIRGMYYTPSQVEAIDFFDHIGCLPFEIFEDIELFTDDLSLGIIRDYFSHYQDTVEQPIDGVVYCASNWRYPQHHSESTPAAYTKYAWKPTSESTSRLKSIDYNIARDGKIGLIVKYDPIFINSKTYKQCKTAPTRMNKLHGIGIGSVITIELCADINPQIKEFEEDESIKPYEFPNKCPFCDGKIKQSNVKDTVTLQCTNPECPEKLVQKYKYLITHMKIKGIAEGKLRKLGNKLSLQHIVDNYCNNGPNVILNALLNVSFRNFLMGVGFGTTTQINRATPKFTASDLMVDNFDELKKLIEDPKDPFITDVLDYIDATCFED